MSSNTKKEIDKYYKEQIDSNIQQEINTFDNIIVMMVRTVAQKYATKCKNPEDFWDVIFNHWECFSELMPPYREFKWHYMQIRKYRDIAEKTSYSKDALINQDKKIRENCVNSLLWFGDVLAYSSGLIKEELKAKRLFGLDD